jgi:hypothetical protein
MPEIDPRILQRLGLIVAGGIFMVVVILAVGMFKNDPVEPDANALWIGPEWTYTRHSADEVGDFARQLRDNRIGAVYALVSELNFDNTWTGRSDGDNLFDEVREDVATFRTQLKQAHGDLQVFGTLNIRADLSAAGYRLDDEAVQEAIAAMSATVVHTLRFDGVMLHIEPVWTGDVHFLDIIRQTRQAIGEDALLAVSVPPDWTPEVEGVPVPSVIAPGTVWSTEYKQRIALAPVNQIVVRSYNTYLTTPADYTAWLAYQVKTYAETVAPLRSGVQVLIGVPTYAADPPAHRTDVENVMSAMAGFERGLADAGDAAGVVRGVAVYANWDTTEEDWSRLRPLLSGRRIG